MGIRFLLLFLAVIVVATLLGYLFSDVVAYLTISLVISAILKPLVNLLHHLEIFSLKMPRWMAVAIVMLGVFGGMAYGIGAGFPIVKEQIQELRTTDLNAVIAKVSKPVRQLERSLQAGGIVRVRPGSFQKYLTGLVNVDVKRSDVEHYVSGLIDVTGSIFTGLLAVGFMTFYFLLERGLLKNAILRFIPNSFYELAVTAFYKMEKLLSSYLTGIAVQAVAIFLLAAFGYWLVGLQYIAVLALLTALLNIIPYIGPLISNPFTILVGLVTTPGISENDYLTFGFTLFAVGLMIQLIDNVFLSPLIFSKSLEAHPLEIFISIFVGSTLGGIIGMIVAIPVYTIVSVTIAEVYAGYRAYSVFQDRERYKMLTKPS